MGVAGPLTRASPCAAAAAAAAARCRAAQVAERVLHFWQNPNFVELVHENLPEVLPIVFPALYKSSKHHWNANVNGLAYTALRVMMHMDPELFEAYSVSYKQIRQQYAPLRPASARCAGRPPRRAHARLARADGGAWDDGVRNPRERQRRKDMEAHWAYIEQMAEQRALQLGLDASLVKALHDGAHPASRARWSRGARGRLTR